MPPITAQCVGHETENKKFVRGNFNSFNLTNLADPTDPVLKNMNLLFNGISMD
jgi:hypothetical protein